MALIDNQLCDLLSTHYPYWQAPLPFDLVSAATAAKISAAGAMGMLRVAPHYSSAKLQQNIEQYQAHYQQPSFCFAHRLPHEQKLVLCDQIHLLELAQQLDIEDVTFATEQNVPFLELLEICLDAKPRAIGFAQGLPDKNILAAISAQGVVTFAICHNVTEAIVAADFSIDIIVLQGMEAGGERCYFENDLPNFAQPAFSLLQQVRHFVKQPIVLWGDFSKPADVMAALISGAQSVMLDRPWLACSENDLHQLGKKHAINSNEYQSRISTNYGARPMRHHREIQTLCADCCPADSREAFFELLFASAPHKRPLPLSLTPIADPQQISDYLREQERELVQFIA